MINDSSSAPPLGLNTVPATEDVLEAVAMRMPFGRFKGERLIDLPEPYIVWFKGQGFPPGALGERMALVYEVKVNGLEKLLRPLLDE
jgi:uncharacterized protein